MAYRKWQVSRIKYCEHVGHEVALEVDVVYPAEHLPDQPPRVRARRCSNARECNLFDKPVCTWCGTNPGHEPL
ncbi:MAG: hypothetical protein Fur0043_09560 [Anaerolineales bacterium]